MIIVLDANVWVSQRMMRSGLGAAFLYAVRRSGAHIGLAEVTRLETRARLTDAASEAGERISGGLTTLAAILGSRPDPELPTREVIERAIDDRFAQLQTLLRPLRPEKSDYELALARVIAKRPPNVRKEQFRDSLLLEQIIREFGSEMVYLVTDDSDFFDSRDRRLVDPSLLAELHARGSRLTILPTMEQLLTAMGGEAMAPDHVAIIDAISRDVLFFLMSDSAKHGFDVGDMTSSSIEAFLTEDHHKLAVSFELQFRALSVHTDSGDVAPLGLVDVSGTATFDLPSAAAENVRIGQIRVTSSAGDLLQQSARIFIDGMATFGARTVPFSLRRLLSPG
jgi:hypothetical protein